MFPHIYKDFKEKSVNTLELVQGFFIRNNRAIGFSHSLDIKTDYKEGLSYIMQPLIITEHLYKDFGETTKVLKDINLQIYKNQVVAIIGPSGTGKSTLLRCLNYLTIPTSGIIIIGDVRIDGKKHTKQDILDLRKQSSMVFQSYNLFKNKTAMQNIMEALMIVHKRPKAEAEEIALKLLYKVGLMDRKDFYPSKLSGGQQQRVGIARALAVNPNVVLFDEPTSALDPELVGEVLNTIKTLAFEGTTMVLVTHEMRFAKEVASRILFLDEGKIMADGSPLEILEKPENPRIRQFLQYVNMQ